MKDVSILKWAVSRLLALTLCLTAIVPQMWGQTYTVAGTANGVLGTSNNWNVNATVNDMTRYGSTTYYYLLKSGSLSPQSGDWYGFKVVTNHSWNNTSYPSDNYNYNVGSSGTYTCVFTFNTSGNKVTLTGPFQTLTVAGSHTAALGSSWSATDTNNDMTTSDGGITYTLTKSNVAFTTETYGCKVCANHAWDNNGINISYPTSGNKTYSVTEAGNYDIVYTFNTITQELTVTATLVAPVTVDYEVIGSSTLFGGTDWSNGQQMTENNGTYTWQTSSNVHLNAGTYEYKVHGSNGSWYPNDSNKVITITTPGTYSVNISFDGTTVTDEVTLVDEDPFYTYSIYVRYTGDENLNNVLAYSFDTFGNQALGAWGGTALSAMTMTNINGYAYYHTTFTSYDQNAKIIFNENANSSTQTANLDLDYLNDNYFTYGGGSNVDGSNDEADDPDTLYLIGYANNQQWAPNAGIEMVFDETTGLYTLSHVVLTSTSQFAFSTRLGANNTDWTGIMPYRLSSTGDSHWAITNDQFDTWLSYQKYVNDNHNWYVNQAGAYDITVDMANKKIKVTPCHEDMYISYGVNWTYADNSLQMTTVDGNIYQATINLNQGDYFLFSTNKSDLTAWGAPNGGFDITDLMLGYTQDLTEGSLYNYHFTGTTGKYIVVVNKEKSTVTLRKTVDATEKTTTKIYLEKTDNVSLDADGGTYHSQTLPDKRGGIFVWNKVNLLKGGAYYTSCETGPSNYTYDNEVSNNYPGNGYLQDLPDTTTVDGKNWYAWSAANSICDFYFIRDNTEDHKSQNVMRRAGEVWLTWTDLTATSNRQDNAVRCDSIGDVTRNYYAVSASGVSDCATMLEGHYYVYYTNTTGWDSVYCYAWYEDADTVIEITDVYPGKKCTFVGYDEDGYEVWCYDFGLIEDMATVPTNVIFDNGRGAASEGEQGDKVREQTGDMVFNNGACYDCLGLIYLGNSLNAIINSGIVNGPKYTVEDNLIGVYYDEDALTEIIVKNENNVPIDTVMVQGALYAKDLDNYSAKSRITDDATDYVYDICAHRTSDTYPGGSQIQLKRTSYDQSNWVKIVLSPNFDNANAKSNGDVTYEGEFDDKNFETVGNNYLAQYVGHIIPGHSMSGNLVNNVNPQMHITNIAPPGDEQAYENNVYVTGHFNDTVVFTYVHQDWNPGVYNGVYRTVPHLATDEQGNYLKDESGHYYVDAVEVKTDKLYKMFYVAPKPQEIAYITWAVFDHPNDSNNVIGTENCTQEPKEPGAFYSPMNWNRTGQLWSDPNDPDAAWGTTYGPYSNGYMQYGAFQVNWSLFGDDQHRNEFGQPWYQIFKPGQAYKILALIRYAYGDTPEDVEYTAGVAGGSGYNEGPGNHVSNAPRRSNTTWADMDVVPYNGLNSSKFIVFPLMGNSEDSNGSNTGNVTAIKEVKTSRTVTSVRYFNLMGVESSKPFDGINIVVTTYSDGSRTSKKVLR